MRSKKPIPGCPLIAEHGLDTIDKATCALEYLAEVLSEYKGESCPDGEEGDRLTHGQYLLWTTISGALRHGMEQLHNDRNQAKGKVIPLSAGGAA